MESDKQCWFIESKKVFVSLTHRRLSDPGGRLGGGGRVGLVTWSQLRHKPTDNCLCGAAAAACVRSFLQWQHQWTAS